jgi:Na+/proline symporter
LALALLSIRAINAEAGALPIVVDLAKPAEAMTPIRWSGYLLPVFLLVLGDANLYQRFMSAKSPADARLAAIFMFVGVLILEGAVIGIACLGRQLLPVEPEIHGNTVILVAFTLLPAWLGVLLTVSIVAVIVTTADSYLLGSATSVSADLTGGLSTAARQRIVAFLLGLIAMGLSFTSESFFRIAIYAYTLYGATLTPAVVAALVRPQTPGPAVVAGMAGGLIVALGWKALLVAGGLPQGVADIDPVLPALAANLLLLVVFTLILQRRVEG